MNRTTLNPARIRALLRAAPDGMRVKEIAEALTLDPSGVSRHLHRMPDAYIDRWVTSRGAPVAVWTVVEVPENCPRPGRKGYIKKKDRREVRPA